MRTPRETSQRAAERAAQRTSRPRRARAAGGIAERGPRSRNGLGALSEHEIVERTLGLIRSGGLEGLSMRRLATELGVAPMSLYHHVKNKDELLERVVDALFARIPTPPARRAGWREQLRAYGVAVIEQLTIHPGIARVVTERPPTIEGRRHVRYTSEVLIAAGFDPRTAAQCLATFHTFLYGVLSAQAHLPALMAVTAQNYDPQGEGARNASAASKRARSVSDHLRKLDLRKWHQAGIDSILSAIALQLPPARRARVPRASQPAAGTRAARNRRGEA